MFVIVLYGILSRLLQFTSSEIAGSKLNKRVEKNKLRL